jgi:tetratricopeptide (TPR) repeat protein
MDEAIERDPNNVQFLMNRAQCHFELKNFTESIQDLERALSIDEHDPKVLYKLGLSYYAYEKFKRCIKTLKRALK